MNSGLWFFPLLPHIFPESSQPIYSLLLSFESSTSNTVTFARIPFLNSRQAKIFLYLDAQRHLTCDMPKMKLICFHILFLSLCFLLILSPSININPSNTYSVLKYNNEQDTIPAIQQQKQTSKLTMHTAAIHQLPEQETLGPCFSNRRQRTRSTCEFVRHTESGPGSEPTF